MGRRGRSRCMRVVRDVPVVDYFKPRGIPLIDLSVSRLKIEELEAIRLVDLEGMEHEQAAGRMNVSRRTLARELKSARNKIADALIYGKAIEMKGGNFYPEKKEFTQDIIEEKMGVETGIKNGN